jgi:hypothetical protein
LLLAERVVLLLAGERLGLLKALCLRLELHLWLGLEATRLLSKSWLRRHCLTRWETVHPSLGHGAERVVPDVTACCAAAILRRQKQIGPHITVSLIGCLLFAQLLLL